MRSSTGWLYILHLPHVTSATPRPRAKPGGNLPSNFRLLVVRARLVGLAIVGDLLLRARRQLGALGRLGLELRGHLWFLRPQKVFLSNAAHRHVAHLATGSSVWSTQ